MTFGSLSAMCTASGDVGWFSEKTHITGTTPLCQAWHQCTEERILASRFTPCTVPLSTHPYTDINTWGVTKSFWRQKLETAVPSNMDW